MDDALREKIRTLAEENNLDPQTLEATLNSGNMPEELQQSMAAVLADIGLFSEALGKLDT